MMGKIQTAAWFLSRPTHWAFAAELTARKFRPGHDRPECRARARVWAGERAGPVVDALTLVGLPTAGGAMPALDPSLVAESEERAARSDVRMGGRGDVNLLFAAVKLSNARQVVETGVAYGWSSLAILAALEGRDDAKLVSVDMPYPKMNNEPFVGIVVPERLRGPWQIVREPDRRGLKKALSLAGVHIDLCHYDSDKSWWGRQYAFPLLWEALRPGGIFISDDIQDNMAFADFVTRRNLRFAITEFEGKYVGITRKP